MDDQIAYLCDRLKAAVNNNRRCLHGEIPDCLVAALVAAEDRRFWNHGGVDLAAIWAIHLSRSRASPIAGREYYRPAIGENTHGLSQILREKKDARDGSCLCDRKLDYKTRNRRFIPLLRVLRLANELPPRGMSQAGSVGYDDESRAGG